MTSHAMPSSQQIAQINITPLVDVLLVLLVIFMIAAPVVSHPITLDTPGRGEPRPVESAPPIVLRIDASGQLYWNGNATPIGALRAMLQAEVARAPTHAPELRIDASDDADYGVVAKVLAAARNAEVERIGFLRR